MYLFAGAFHNCRKLQPCVVGRVLLRRLSSPGFGPTCATTSSVLASRSITDPSPGMAKHSAFCNLMERERIAIDFADVVTSERMPASSESSEYSSGRAV